MNKLEINVRVFPDRGSVLVSIEQGLLVTPGAVIALLRSALQDLEEMYQTGSDEYLLSNENPQKQ